MIVVDANIIAYLVVKSEHSTMAQRVAEKDMEWCAPRLWRSEMLNVLTGFVRSGGMSVDGALSVLRDARLAVISDITVDDREVLELVRISRCSSYDCEYVAAAEALHVPLVTADKQILRSFPNIAISMSSFLGQ